MNVRTIAITVIIALTMLVLAISCSKSADKKVVDAESNVAEAQQDANDANAQSAWQIFKSEAEAKIAVNERTIADYKARMTATNGKLNAKYDKKIDALEKKNAELKTKLLAYKEDSKTDWEQFKNEMNTDLDGLGTALKGFVVNDKK